MACLLLTEQIASTTQVHVVLANLEAGAEPTVFLKDLKSFRGRAGDIYPRIKQKKCEAPPGATADPPAKLMQLREAKPIGTPDEHRIGTGKVETTFYDVRGQQHVPLTISETKHGFVDRLRRQLPVQDADIQFWDDLAQLLFYGSNVFNTGTDEKALTTPKVLITKTTSHR